MSFARIRECQVALEDADYSFREAVNKRMRAETEMVKALVDIEAFDLLKINRTRVRNLLRDDH